MAKNQVTPTPPRKRSSMAGLMSAPPLQVDPPQVDVQPARAPDPVEVATPEYAKSGRKFPPLSVSLKNVDRAALIALASRHNVAVNGLMRFAVARLLADDKAGTLDLSSIIQPARNKINL